jgi:hypothetical protein
LYKELHSQDTLMVNDVGRIFGMHAFDCLAAANCCCMHAFELLLLLLLLLPGWPLGSASRLKSRPVSAETLGPTCYDEVVLLSFAGVCAQDDSLSAVVPVRHCHLVLHGHPAGNRRCTTAA